MSKNILAIILVAVVALSAVGTTVVIMAGGGNNGSEESDSYSIRLEVSQGDGTYKEYDASGSTVKEILQTVLGDDIVIKSNGNVHSYNGVVNTDDRSWIVFRWQSLKGWVPAKDSDLRDGSTLVLEFAEKVVSNNKVEYVQPQFSVITEVYFFLQIPSMSEIESIAKSGDSVPDDKSEGTKLTASERFDKLMAWMERAGLDIPAMEAGIWIKGSGTNVNEALADAVHTCLFPSMEADSKEVKGVMEYYLDGEVVHSHLTRTDQYGWFTGFLGWADTKLSNGDWTYWSQFTYNPNAKTMDDTRQWTYDTLCLGMYDMSKYHYYALILQTTTVQESEEGMEVNIPTPADIPEGL